MIKFVRFYKTLVILTHFTPDASLWRHKNSKILQKCQFFELWPILDFLAYCRACKNRTGQAMIVKFGEVIHHNTYYKSWKFELRHMTDRWDIRSAIISFVFYCSRTIGNFENFIFPEIVVFFMVYRFNYMSRSQDTVSFSTSTSKMPINRKIEYIGNTKFWGTI